MKEYTVFIIKFMSYVYVYLTFFTENINFILLKYRSYTYTWSIHSFTGVNWSFFVVNLMRNNSNIFIK